MLSCSDLNILSIDVYLKLADQHKYVSDLQLNIIL